MGILFFGASLLFCAQVTSAQSPTPVLTLPSTWKMSPGDNPDWAKPDFDDSGWETVNISKAWIEEEGHDYRHTGWYRLTVHLNLTSFESACGLAVSPVTFSGYEVFVNGKRIGQIGKFSPLGQTFVPVTTIFPLSSELVDASGRVVIALRTRWDQPFAKAFYRWRTFPASTCRIGNFAYLSLEAQTGIQQDLLQDVPRLFVASLIALVGLYHLLLFAQRRQLKEYLWFALITFSISLVAISISLWPARHFAVENLMAGTRVGSFFAIIFGFEFADDLFGTGNTKWVRSIQALLVLCVVLVVVYPPVVMTQFTRVSLSFPLIWGIWFSTVVFRKAWLGNTDARIISVGIVGVIVSQIFMLASVEGYLPAYPPGPVGFLVLVVSMLISLSTRFSRINAELDALNRDLEAKVEQRTLELADANQQLAAANAILHDENRLVRERELEARTHAQQAQLQMLRYQLNPHFLFNVLNSIGVLAFIDPKRTFQMVTGLSEFLRYSLQTTDITLAPLKDEIKAIRHYLELQQVRFEERLEIQFEISPDSENIRLPAFLIQPLVENAIKYGMQTSPKRLLIRLMARQHRNRLELRIANTGQWVSEVDRPLFEEGTGIGLSNVQTRLAKSQFRRTDFRIFQSNGWVWVRIRVTS
ncbi:MAG TPA: histidine kinase [Acidobacteriota bacterium]|nr:histidine kinase [Acidobacteriota bacterium]HNJ39325.1 histidine kinase [Acidobacteriota bacterium]